MKTAELNQRFLNLLEDNQKEIDVNLSAIELSHLFTYSALLVTVMSFIKEQNWLQDRKDDLSQRSTSYEDFLSPFFVNDLLPFLFLKEFLISSGKKQNKKISKDSTKLEGEVLEFVMNSSAQYQKEFLINSLLQMNEHFICEEKKQFGWKQSDGHKGLNLYRTFDNLDEIFKLNYQLDRDMIVDSFAKERLYQNAGVGVQSGYSTILLALHNMNALKGQTIIDLGSGYGRVGLVCSLLRPDLNFIGYEFVPHRVDVSNLAKQNLEISSNLNFYVQDLSLSNFKIPSADIFYLYDPFTEETYKYVLEQIIKISLLKKVTIVTKGNANGWLMKISNDFNWPKPQLIDEGNLCIFCSDSN